MNMLQVGELIFIAAVLAVMCVVEKKDPENARRVLYWAFVGSMGAVVPFAVIETLSAFGVCLFDVAWAFTPLNVMSGMCAAYLVVLSSRKLFGIVDTSK